MKFVLDRKWLAAQIAPVNAETKPVLELVPKNFNLGRLRYSLSRQSQQAAEPAGYAVLQSETRPTDRRSRQREPSRTRPGLEPSDVGDQNPQDPTAGQSEQLQKTDEPIEADTPVKPAPSQPANASEPHKPSLT